MIVGVGIDLVSIERLAESLKSEAFKRRVFSPAPVISASGEAGKTLAALGSGQVHVSISHTGETAVAVVILEGELGYFQDEKSEE